MKKTVTLFLSLLASASIAQTTYKVDSLIYYENNELSEKCVLTHDTEGKVIAEKCFDPDGTQNYDLEITYDANGNQILDVFKNTDEQGVFGLAGKTEYTYNALQLLTEETDYLWDNSMSDFIPESKDIFTYNSNDYLVEEMSSSWSTENGTAKWLNHLRVQYTYNSNNQLQTEINSSYFNDKWSLDAKNELFYNERELLKETQTSGWFDEWILGSKEIRFYDEFDNDTLVGVFVEDEITGDFTEAVVKSFQTFENGNTVSQRGSAIKEDGSLGLSFATDTEYDLDINENNLVTWHYLELDDVGFKVNNLISSYSISAEWNDTTQTFDEKTRVELKTSEIVLVPTFGLGNVLRLTAFPNPANDIINIVTEDYINAQLTVYDLSGNQVMTQTVKNAQTTLSISGLSIGVYLYEVQSDIGLVKGKFIKE